MIRVAKRLIEKYRVLNYMIAGGIGYILTLGTYYPLILLFRTQTDILGQSFYLPPFLISAAIGMVCNYILNKHWTFSKYQEKSVSLGRYTVMTISTIWIDVIILWCLVHFLHLYPVLAAALAIALIFILRYTICRRWIWTIKEEKAHELG